MTGHNEHEFRCRSDRRCIPRELKCDKIDNCGDWSDEGVSACGLSKYISPPLETAWPVDDVQCDSL